jgi:hypothetical protein
MAWVTVPGSNSLWEYNNAPADPGASSPYYELWLKQTAGVRTHRGIFEVYTNCRRTGTTTDVGELSKSYYDAQV